MLFLFSVFGLVYKEMSEAMSRQPKADVMVNFASLRSAYDSTMEAMQYPQIRTIAIIAEGIPEAKTRVLISKANELGVTIIGPATVCTQTVTILIWILFKSLFTVFHQKPEISACSVGHLARKGFSFY